MESIDVIVARIDEKLKALTEANEAQHLLIIGSIKELTAHVNHELSECYSRIKSLEQCRVKEDIQAEIKEKEREDHTYKLQQLRIWLSALTPAGTAVSILAFLINYHIIK